ncbi:MAG: LysE family transporter [Rhizobiaceae bacterium]
MEPYLSFLAAAFALAGSPGPNTLSLAAVGAAFGYRRGIGYMLGLTLGMLLVIALVGSGVAGLLLLVPGASPAVAAAAAAYFIYLAWKIATAPPLSGDAADGNPPSWFAAVFVSLANPKAYAAMAAMFSGFVLVAASPLGDTIVKAAVLLGVIAVVNIVWLRAGAALTPLFRAPRASRFINIGFAAALLISVAAAVLI